MTHKKDEFKLIFERMKQALSHCPDEFNHWIEWTESYMQAASEMTKDEWALIEAYLKRDLQMFGSHYGANSAKQTDLFSEAITNTIWERLAKITDKTQLEWQEILHDLDHHGVYQAGELVGLGILVCEHCGHETQHTRVGVINKCVRCDHQAFQRKPFPA